MSFNLSGIYPVVSFGLFSRVGSEVRKRILVFLCLVLIYFFLLFSSSVFSLSWLDLKAQAACLLRRLDDAPTHPPPPPGFCLVAVWDTQTSLFLFWLADPSLSLSLVFSSRLCRSERYSSVLTGTLTRARQGAPFLSCSAPPPVATFVVLSFSLVLIRLLLMPFGSSQRF